MDHEANPKDIVAPSCFVTGSFLTTVYHINTGPFYYRPQTKFAKVMLSQVSVCPQGRGHAWQRVCVAGGMLGRGVCVGGYAWQGVCMAVGCAWQGDIHGSRVCVGRGDLHGGGAW